MITPEITAKRYKLFGASAKLTKCGYAPDELENVSTTGMNKCYPNEE